MTPWKLPRSEHRSVAFDPCVPLGFPQRASDADIEALWRQRVRKNELRRFDAQCDRIVWLRKQAD